jgi:hypothetical protein
MVRYALIIAVVNALYCLTVDADGPAGMLQRAGEGIVSLPALRKALTAGAVTVTGMLAAHHNVPLAAEAILVVGAIFHTAF